MPAGVDEAVFDAAGTRHHGGREPVFFQDRPEAAVAHQIEADQPDLFELTAKFIGRNLAERPPVTDWRMRPLSFGGRVLCARSGGGQRRRRRRGTEQPECVATREIDRSSLHV
jgi:hypothetical protein